MDLQGSILVISPDEFAACPHCGARLETPIVDGALVESGADIDGPIYQGTCPRHGAFQWQIAPDEDCEPCPIHRQPVNRCPDSCEFHR